MLAYGEHEGGVEDRAVGADKAGELAVGEPPEGFGRRGLLKDSGVEGDEDAGAGSIRSSSRRFRCCASRAQLSPPNTLIPASSPSLPSPPAGRGGGCGDRCGLDRGRLARFPQPETGGPGEPNFRPTRLNTTVIGPGGPTIGPVGPIILRTRGRFFLFYI